MFNSNQLSEFLAFCPHSRVAVIDSGYYREVVYNSIPTLNRRRIVSKIDKDNYDLIDTKTGECITKKYVHSEKRNMNSLKKSVTHFRRLIWANADRFTLFVTLTYKQNMCDVVRLQTDFHAFIKRFRRANPDCLGYLLACEPQARGAWHIHCLFYFAKKKFLSNSFVRNLWGWGFVKIQKVDAIRNLGAYLTSYLCNFKGKKAARLDLYPPYFRFWRFGGDVEKPKKNYINFSRGSFALDMPIYCKFFKRDFLCGSINRTMKGFIALFRTDFQKVSEFILEKSVPSVAFLMD